MKAYCKRYNHPRWYSWRGTAAASDNQANELHKINRCLNEPNCTVVKSSQCTVDVATNRHAKQRLPNRGFGPKASVCPEQQSQS